MKKTFLVSVATAAILSCGVCGLAACSPQASTSSENASVSYTEDSIMGQHEARGTDITNLTEVSIDSCTGSGCHGGSWDSIIESTDAIWEGIGQIPDANPHAAHATNGFVCENCHSLTEGPSINECNGCHAFETPEGWVDKDSTTTIYGLTTEEPLY